MAVNTKHSVSEIGTRFKNYRMSMLDNWEISHFLDHYLEELKPLIKSKSIKKFELDSFQNSERKKKYKTYDVSKLLGVISRINSKTLPYRTLLEAVFLTEDYAQQLTRKVLTDYSQKLPSVKNEEDLLEGKYNKLLHLIVTHEDKNEIIDKIVEEKVRGIFYGNPVDFYKLDKAQIGFGTEIKNKYPKALELYSEIIARRNIIVHNNGKVDRKYLSEVKGTKFSLNEKVKIDHEYISKSLKILIGISAVATDLVITNVYKRENTSQNQKSIIKLLKTISAD